MGVEQLDANFKSCSVDDETFHMLDIPDWMLEGFFWESENENVLLPATGSNHPGAARSGTVVCNVGSGRRRCASVSHRHQFSSLKGNLPSALDRAPPW